MKHRIISAVMILLLLFMCGCSKKSSPVIKIKNESVTTVVFKKTGYSDTDAAARTYTSKTITERRDIDNLIDWLETFALEKQSAIEIPVEQVEFVIELKGTILHKLIFLGGYVVLDTTAYTFKNASDKLKVLEKYNLLNYAETKAELDLM